MDIRTAQFLFKNLLFSRLQLLALNYQWHLGKEYPPSLVKLLDNVELSGYPSSVRFSFRYITQKESNGSFQGKFQVISEPKHKMN